MLIADEVKRRAGPARCSPREQMALRQILPPGNRSSAARRQALPAGRRDGRYRAGRAGRHLCRKPDCLGAAALAVPGITFEQENLLPQKANTLANAAL